MNDNYMNDRAMFFFFPRERFVIWNLPIAECYLRDVDFDFGRGFDSLSLLWANIHKKQNVLGQEYSSVA